MATNKVILNGEVKIDLTNDTVKPEEVVDGKTFHGADGIQRTGTLAGSCLSKKLCEDSIENTIMKIYIPEGVTIIKSGYRFFNAGYYRLEVDWPDSIHTVENSIIHDNPYSNWHIYVNNL
jgi:hypothetical protein